MSHRPGKMLIFVTRLAVKHAFTIYSYIIVVACPVLNLRTQSRPPLSLQQLNFSLCCRLSVFVSRVVVWFLQ